MRWFVVVAVCVLAEQGLCGQSARLTQLPPGTISGNLYTNDAVGVAYEIPAGWTANLNLPSQRIDTGRPDDLANTCSKVLVRLSAPGKEGGRFASIAELIAIDPVCISGPAFPQTMKDIGKMNKVADRIIKVYRDSPFFSRYGVKITAFDLQNRVVLGLAGDMTINAIEGPNAATREPLAVHTSFDIAEWNGYWIAWCFVADGGSVEKLGNVKFLLNQ